MDLDLQITWKHPVFAGEVAGGENYSNLFYTHPATYLPLILLGQPISKSYSRCPSLLSLGSPDNSKTPPTCKIRIILS